MTVKLSLSSVAPEEQRCDVLAVGVYADRSSRRVRRRSTRRSAAPAAPAADADFKGGLGWAGRSPQATVSTPRRCCWSAWASATS